MAYRLQAATFVEAPFAGHRQEKGEELIGDDVIHIIAIGQAFSTTVEADFAGEQASA
jgi:hypothetical protein